MLDDYQNQILIFGISSLGGPFFAACCSQHHFPVCAGSRGKLKEGREEGKKKKKRGCQKNKITFNLFPITAVCTASAEQLLVPVFLFLSRTCLCRELRVAGSQQTLIALRPKAATFKQGHSSSHGKGNGLWPWSLITPLPQCTRSSGKLSDKHSRSYTVHAYTHTHTRVGGLNNQ